VSPYHQIEEERREANREFDRRVEELRELCSHAEWTDWLDDHTERRRVRVCRRCLRDMDEAPREETPA
jgi:hypothetical protein